MARNCLKLNEDETQVIWLGIRQQLEGHVANAEIAERHSAVFNCRQ